MAQSALSNSIVTGLSLYLSWRHRAGRPLVCVDGQIRRSNCCANTARKSEIRHHAKTNLLSEFNLIWGVQSLSKK
jgi:hypothetical protein